MLPVTPSVKLLLNEPEFVQQGGKNKKRIKLFKIFNTFLFRFASNRGYLLVIFPKFAVQTQNRLMANNYRLLNNIIGWVVFLAAAFVFCSTIEPTASFWDCGEYIACANKLEVGHPPGAPTFLLLGRFFSLFAGGDVTKVAMWVNVMSALASAFTILFLYWTITLLGRKLLKATGGELTTGSMFAIFGSGVVGALAYTFSDSFWFSAVEGEVYGMSAFFTAIVFWAILRWDADDSPRSDRWLVFIAYLMGLSIGVHLLNLLAIPAIVFIIYFKKFKPSFQGVMITGVLSILLLGAIQNGIIPGVVNATANTELMFVNGFGAPFSTGTIVFFVLLTAMLVLGLMYANKGNAKLRMPFFIAGGLFFFITMISSFWIGHSSSNVSSFFMRALTFGACIGIVYYLRNNLPRLNTILLSLTVLLIGYSTFFVLIIRSQANTPMDENNPENPISMLAYLQRKQYGDWPLTYGQYFNAPLNTEDPYSDDAPVYTQNPETGVYEITDNAYNSVPNYAPEMSTFFPRMWEGNQRSHAGEYKQWSGYDEKKGRRIKVRNNQGEMTDMVKPSFGQNLSYFFKFQVGWMYSRYFAWNFIGRQNDVQGHGPHHNHTDGGYMSGLAGYEGVSKDKLPENTKRNKGMNNFYYIPFLLGLLGMWYHFARDWKNAFVMLLMFLLTGMAIVIYLNQYPLQPRERDYAYAGSFYAFAVWIGFAVYAIYDLTKKFITEIPAVGLATLACSVAPFLMGSQGWDDHDRSNRYTARDFAKDYLASCAPNAILFTNGDNDTFPLWYVQEVEGFRTDVRVINLSLLNTDWYIDQARRKAYDSDPVPFSLTPAEYRQGTRDQVYVFADEKSNAYRNLREMIDFIKSKDPKTKFIDDRNKNDDGDIVLDTLSYLPSKNLYIPIDKKVAKANGTIPANVPDSLIADSLKWTLNKSYMFKADLMVLDLLATNNWKRPVYFAVTAGSDAYLDLDENFQLEGLAYRLVPPYLSSQNSKRSVFSPARVNTEAMYNNIMNGEKTGWNWGGMDKYDLYMDENNLRMTTNLRIQMMTLADALIQEGQDSKGTIVDASKLDKARKVLNKSLEVMPEKNVPYEPTMLYMVEFFYKLGTSADIEQGNKLAKRLFELSEQDIRFYGELRKKRRKPNEGEENRAQQVLVQLQGIAQRYKQDKIAKEFQDKINNLASSGLFNLPEQQQP